MPLGCYLLRQGIRAYEGCESKPGRLWLWLEVAMCEIYDSFIPALERRPDDQSIRQTHYSLHGYPKHLFDAFKDDDDITQA